MKMKGDMQSMKKRTIAIILVLALLVQFLPANAFAEDGATDPAAVYVAETETGEPEKVVLGEMADRRGESEKHFRMKDGSFIAVDYGIPVHYTDDAGNTWKDIDNTLVLEEDSKGNSEDGALPATCYVSKNGTDSRYFAQDLRTGFLFSSQNGKTGVSFSLTPHTEAGNDAPFDEAPEEPPATEPANPEMAADESETTGEDVTAEEEPLEVPVEEVDQDFNRSALAEISYPDQTDRDGKENQSVAEQVAPAKLRTDVLYRNVLDGVDLSYELYGRNVKESIVINQPRDNYSMDFYMELSGLTPKLLENGAIALYDSDGVEEYLIPAPYMTDANGAFSDAVSYALEESAFGHWRLSVIADQDWINAEDRTFPVAIDPTIIDKTTWANQGIAFTYVVSGAPGTKHSNYQRVDLGYTPLNNLYEHRVFVGWDSLPVLPSASEVVDAQLYIKPYSDGVQLVGRTEMSVELHEVTSSRPSNYASNTAWVTDMTWSNTINPPNSQDPISIDSTVMDYKTVNSDDNGRSISWDITRMVKSWYAPGSQSTTVAEIMLSNLNTYNSQHYGTISFNGYGANTGPMFVVSYRDTVGVEPYYTYQTVGAGRAGGGYISDATGNLTIITPLVSYASGINPFSLNLVYNSIYQSENTGPFHVSKALGYGFRMGWNTKLNVLQKVEAVDLQYESQGSVVMHYLKYTDGDGTAHYFAKDSNLDSTNTYYFDEDGLGLKIKETSTGNYQMEDEKGNKQTFKNGFLSGMTDANGNQILIYFLNGSGTTPTNSPAATGARLHHISQKNYSADEITVASFGYDYDSASNEYTLCQVTDYANDLYRFTYSGNRFYRIFRTWAEETTETKIVEFSYNGATSLIRRMRDFVEDYMVNFEYDSSNRVSRYYEHEGSTSDGTGTDGAGVTITRIPGEKTVYTDWGNDRIEGNADDIKTTYLFDYWGRTVNAYTSSASGELLGASNAVYTGTGGTDKQNNRTQRTSEIGMAAMQLLGNAGFEQTESSLAWTMDSANGATVSVVSNDTCRTGQRALRMTRTSATVVFGAHRLIGNLGGDGNTYTVSAYVNTTGVTAFQGNGVYLKVKDTANHVYQSDPLNYVTDAGVDGGWTRISVTFQPSQALNHTVYLCADKPVGTVYVDDIQVERGNGPSNVNLIENGGLFSNVHGWKNSSGADLTSNDYSSQGTAIQGTLSLKITGNPTEDRYISQTVTMNQPGTQTYVLSGWAKADSVPDNVTTETGDDKLAKDTNKQFGLRAVLTYSDNTKEYHYVPFNPDVTEWQFASLAIVPKEPTKTVSTIKVICAYEKNANTAYFDNLSLVKEAAQTMKYDEDGHLKSVKSTGTNAVTATYSNNNLTRLVTDGDGTFDYTYDSKHRMTSAKNDFVKETYAYDAAGNVTSSSLTKADGTGARITAGTEYTYDKNRVQKSTAANGAETSYSYSNCVSLMHGLPSKVTNPAGTETNISYCKDGSTEMAYISNYISTVHTYDEKNRLTQLTRGGYNRVNGSTAKQNQYYYFAYDGFGNTTSISVGSATSSYTLGTYTYAPKNGLLTRMTYGNGAWVNYTYDHLGRKSLTTTSGGDSYSYRYTGDGQLYEMTDTAGGLNYRYLYDTLGRLIGSSMKSGSSMVLQTWHRYNENNKLTRQDWIMPGASYYTQYFYDTNGRLTQQRHTLPTGITAQSLVYDDLNRISQLITTKYQRLYQYKAGSGTNTTTGLVSQLKLETRVDGGFATKTFNYTYDILGNIKKIVGNGDTWTYTYDNQSQLTQANCNNNSYIWNYQYDTYGNVRYRDYRVGVSVQDSITYTYGNSKWKDLLTAISGTKNGTSFSGSYAYDGIGNPTSYYNVGDLTSWSMSWRNGRELATAANGTKTASYEYDVNGLRTQKTVNGVTHSYIYASGRLLRDTWTDDGVARTLDFFYDPNGHAYTVFYQKGSSRARFYVLTNLQGDVIGLLDTSSQLVAEYSYDPYGNLLTTTNYATSGLASEICDLNPLRYRGYYYDAETGFYYLQSRYYDPALGRFINADSYGSTGQGFLGYNMFAYCGNNPVNGKDQNGNRPLNVNTMMTDSGGGFIPLAIAPHFTPDYVQYCQAHGRTLKEAKKEYYDFESNEGTTFIFGFSGRAACGYSANGSAYIAIDTHGNVALYLSGGLGGGLPSASASFFAGVVRCPNAKWMNGLTIATGGSIGEGFGISGDYIIVIDNDRNNTYRGVTTSFGAIAGIPTPAETHCDTSYSFMVFSFNIFG